MGELTVPSPDPAATAVARIAELFPHVVTVTRNPDGVVVSAVDIDLLREVLSGQVVEGAPERYQLDWPGKRASLAAASSAVAATLRPQRNASVDFDTTANLFIEGDNLDALKLLRPSYAGKVAMIYIDPPYNTGNDFLYRDAFATSAADYLRSSGQVDASGSQLVTTTQSDGRFHAAWLSLMYPRLVLARDLLTDDGVIFISIDDNEVGNLLSLCGEVFGEANHVNTFVWVNNLKGRQIGHAGAVGTKEYIVCFARRADAVSEFRAPAAKLKALMPTVYKGFNYEVQHDDLGPYVVKNELHNTNSGFNEVTRPNLVFDIYYDPTAGEVRTEPVSHSHLHAGWVKVAPKRNNNGVHRYHAFRWSRRKVETEAHNLAFVESATGWKVFTKVRDVDTTAVKDLIMDINTNAGSSDLAALGLGRRWFDYPKPVDLVTLLCEIGTTPDSIVLDFFAGSATTAHAVMRLNAADGGRRRFIQVQLPVPLPESSEAARAGLTTIADLARERIRRAGTAISEAAQPGTTVDLGFRAFRVEPKRPRTRLPS
jgi:adenine-specific DNA-methyltransferase